ncbi:MAG: proline racemase family protein [Pirellulales bacterium]
MRRVTIVDSHTGGEPTRVITADGPPLGVGTPAELRERFRAEFDLWRRTIVCEPRGSDVLVGAVLLPPVREDSVAGTIFFNNVGYLGMCGHGAIGLMVTLGHLGRIAAGRHGLETPVGRIELDYDGANRVTFENVPSYRFAAEVPIDVPGYGRVIGDIAWGGNWFFLVKEHGETLIAANVVRLTQVAQAIQNALNAARIGGADGAPIDHIELFGPPADPRNHSRNFVLCPGGAYDRSPCGTGTSAKVACLAADGTLRPGETWRQESITGSRFAASYREANGLLLPRIAGEAFVTAEATLLIDDADPLAWGISGG